MLTSLDIPFELMKVNEGLYVFMTAGYVLEFDTITKDGTCTLKVVTVILIIELSDLAVRKFFISQIGVNFIIYTKCQRTQLLFCF